MGGAHFFPQEPLLSFYPGTMEGGGPQDLAKSVALDERVKQKMSDRQVTNLEALELDDLDHIF